MNGALKTDGSTQDADLQTGLTLTRHRRRKLMVFGYSPTIPI